MSGLSANRRVALYLTLAAASWGAGTAISKRAVAEIPPLTLLPIQLAVSVTVLVLLMRGRGENLNPAARSSLLGRLGLLNPGLAYSLSLLGLVSITASLSVLLWAVEPVMILVLAAAFLGERGGRALVGLSAVAVTGMVLVLYDPASAGQWPGVLLTLAGVACCAAYTVVARRFLPAAESTMGVVVVQQVYALALALVVLVAIGLLGGRVWPDGLTVVGAVSVVGSGVFYYGLAYWFYLSALRHVPASVAAVSFYLIPVFGIAAGAGLGERLDLRQWIGAAIVVLAVAAVAWLAARVPRAEGDRTTDTAT
ncbi:MAG: DMT family transporter [Candidatus Limnocylindrales bacterium]